MPVGVLDVLPEDDEEQHVAEDVIPAPVQEHRGEPADAPRLRCVTGGVDRARIEGRVVDRGAEVGELEEDPDTEVGDDQRNVDEREAAGRDAV